MRLIQLQKTSSTNSYLRSRLKEEPRLPTYPLIDTYAQTAGRGQRGNSWESNPGENITCSLLLRPTLPPQATTFDLNIITSLALHDLITSYIDSTKVQVKWPNDLMVEERKVAGILIENEWLGTSLQYSIVGIGLNVTQTYYQAYHPEATSLLLEGAKLPTTHYSAWHQPMLEQMVTLIQQRLENLPTQLPALREEYHQHLLGYHTPKHYQLPTGEKLTGSIQQIRPNGLLELEIANGAEPQGAKEIRTFSFKEIAWLG